MIDPHSPAKHPLDRSRQRRLAAVLAVTVLACGAFLFRRPSAALTAVQPPVAMTVTATRPVEVRWPELLEASGAIAAWQEAIIGVQVAGLRLVEVRANVGDQIKRGQLLARFDADLLRADEVRLKALWQQAEANRERALLLKGKGVISEQNYLQFTTQAEVAKAQLQAAQLQLTYTDVIAPDDGAISARIATVGAVSANGQELFRMIRRNRLEWRGELTAVQLARVRPGQRVRLALPDGGTTNATVRQTAPALDAQTRLGIVFADIAPNNGARQGMYATGRVVLAESTAMTLPAASVIIRDGRSYVATLTAEDRVNLQSVVVGRRQADQVEILSGVPPDAKVVVHGAGFLNDGDLVRIVSATSAKE